MAALYGSAYGAMNPDNFKQPVGPTPAEQESTRRRARAAQAKYAEQNPTPFSPLANDLAARQKAKMPDGSTSATAGPPKEPPVEQDTTMPEKPKGIIIPDPNTNPGAAISAAALNRGAGLGNGAGLVPIPQAPTMQDTTARAVEEEGKQTLFSMNKIPKPMESNAFNMGLMSFGLNLLSGNDLATSFNQGGAHFQQAYGREKREIWAQDLTEQGYDAQDVQRWIDTGDNNDLKDPMEKKMKMQQYRLGQENLSSAIYQNSPEMRKYATDKDQYNMQMEQAKFQSQQNFQNENLKIAQTQANISNEQLKLAQSKHAATVAGGGAGAGGKADPKMFMSGLMTSGLQYGDVIKAAAYVPKITDYAKAYAVDGLPKFAQEYAKQSWTPEMHAMNQVRNQVSELLGRGLSGAALSEVNERPTWSNALLPTPQELKNNDINALKRKENVFNALKVYSNKIAAEGPKAQGLIDLNDVEMLGNGSAQMLIDDQTGMPAGIMYTNGQIKQF